MIYYKGKAQGAGVSAYDLAKAKGYTGTEEEFALILVAAGNKADKATMLSGYGITDAYTKNRSQRDDRRSRRGHCIRRSSIKKLTYCG